MDRRLESYEQNEHNDAVTSDALHLRRLEDTLRTRYHSWTFLDESSLPSSLLTHLISALPHIDVEEWPERLDFGGAYINGVPALEDSQLPCPCRIEYYEPKFAIAQAHEIYPAFDESFLLFTDGDIAVVYKPDKLPSMPAKEQRHFSVKRSVEHLVEREVHMPSRLDVSTQGIIVMSVSPRAHGGLQRAFESRSVEKRYALATRVKPTWNRHTTTSSIARDERHAVLRKASKTEGLSASTEFIVCGESPHGLAVIEARPSTGRTHQIRVHAQELGIPIAGDNFYGGEHAPILHLLSRSISFPHPVSGEQMTFELPRHLLPDWAQSISWPL